MYLRVLGGPVAVADGPEGDLELPRDQLRPLVTAWVVTGRLLSPEETQRVIWGDDGADHRRELSTVLWELRRKHFGDRIVTKGARPHVQGYSLNMRSDVDTVDLSQFRELTARGAGARQRDLKKAASFYQQAVDLCGPPDLQPFPDRPKVKMLVGEFAKVLDEVSDARTALVELRLALGEHEHVLPFLKGWVAADPWDEHPRRWLMIALYRCGKKAESLRTYRELEDLLRRDAHRHAKPSPALQVVHAQIIADHPDLAPQPVRPPSQKAWSIIDPGEKDWRSPELVVDRPVVARIMDALRGGRNNYEPDRVAAAAVMQQVPGLEKLLKQHDEFRRRVIRELAAEGGIDQWLDLGSGLPPHGEVLPISREVVPHSRLVYVDSDPVVGTHIRHLIADRERTAFVQEDLKDPPSVLNDPETRRVLDFSKPVGLLMTIVLHLFPEDVTDVIDAYVKAMAPGSYLVISAVVSEGLPEEVLDVSREHVPLFHPRSLSEFVRWFRNLEIVAPGIIDCQHWRRPGTLPKPTNQRVLCAVGWKPGKGARRI